MKADEKLIRMVVADGDQRFLLAPALDTENTTNEVFKPDTLTPVARLIFVPDLIGCQDQQRNDGGKSSTESENIDFCYTGIPLTTPGF